MWNDFSTQTTWNCNDCGYQSEYPMSECLDCNSESISNNTVDHSGGERDWEIEDEDDRDED